MAPKWFGYAVWDDKVDLICRLVELIIITSRQVRLRSHTRFHCPRCNNVKLVKLRCTKHAKAVSVGSLYNRTHRKTIRLSMAEIELKLAFADSLQSWADSRFLQSVGSNLESLPQLAIAMYAFYTGQLLKGSEWVNCKSVFLIFWKFWWPFDVFQMFRFSGPW